MGARNQVGIGLLYRPASLYSLVNQFQTRFLESIPRPIVGLKFPTQIVKKDYIGENSWTNRASIFFYLLLCFLCLLQSACLVKLMTVCSYGSAGLPGLKQCFLKILRSPLIDSKESIPPAFVAWRAGTTTLILLGS